MKGNVVIIAVVALIVGLVLGYGASSLKDKGERGENMEASQNQETGNNEKGQVMELGDGPGDKATDQRIPEVKNLSDLKNSKITMADALKQVDSKYSQPIEAKFETGDDGKLSLSIYPTGKGINTDAERNVFQELSGDPTVSSWSPKLDVFTDQEHLTRSARDLTLVQTVGITLAQAVDKVNAKQPGFVYWAIPTIREGHTGYGVYTLDDSGKIHYFFID